MQMKNYKRATLALLGGIISIATMGISNASAARFNPVERNFVRDVHRDFPRGGFLDRHVERFFRRTDDGRIESRVRVDFSRELPNGRRIERHFERKIEREPRFQQRFGY